MTGPIVLVCGGRDYADRAKVFAVLDEIQPRVVVQGACWTWSEELWDWVGADYFALRWAITHRVPHGSYPAEWSKYGRGAGPIRNQRMLDEQKRRGEAVELVVAFEGGKGAGNMIALARKAGIEVREIS